MKGPLPYVVTANGQVEASRTVSVQSLVSGMLTNVAITEGDEVRAGQVIFQIDQRPFQSVLDRVKGTLARDEAILARTRADSVRFAGLAKDGYITKQQLDQTFSDAQSAGATVAADRAQVQSAQLDLDNTTIRAPIGGRTGQLTIKAGNLVRAQTDALITINELRPVFVRFSVAERDFAEMRTRAGLDKALTVSVKPNVGDSAKVATGILSFINNVVDQTTGTVLLKARVANDDRGLWPGQFVTVGLQLSIDSNAVTVPSEAVVTTAAGSFVYIVADSSKVKRVPVKIGRQSGGLLKIDSGLEGGEQVVIEGQNRLNDGAKIELRAATTAGGGRGGRGGRGGGRGGRGGNDSGSANGSGKPAGDSIPAPKGKTP